MTPIIAGALGAAVGSSVAKRSRICQILDAVYDTTEKASERAAEEVLCGPNGELEMSVASAKSADVLPIAESATAASAVGSTWYVVHTHVHSEAKAAAHLARQGYLAYLPRYLKKRRHARRTDTVAAPLFPRYLFVGFDPQACRWRSIHSTVGVAHLVCNGDEPATVPSKVVEQLKRREDGNGFICLERPRLAPGARIEVVDGVFSSCFGLYEGMADSDRVKILLDLLGRKVRVMLNGEAIAAA